MHDGAGLGGSGLRRSGGAGKGPNKRSQARCCHCIWDQSRATSHQLARLAPRMERAHAGRLASLGAPR